MMSERTDGTSIGVAEAIFIETKPACGDNYDIDQNIVLPYLHHEPTLNLGQELSLYCHSAVYPRTPRKVVHGPMTTPALP